MGPTLITYLKWQLSLCCFLSLLSLILPHLFILFLIDDLLPPVGMIDFWAKPPVTDLFMIEEIKKKKHLDVQH